MMRIKFYKTVNHFGEDIKMTQRFIDSYKNLYEETKIILLTSVELSYSS